MVGLYLCPDLGLPIAAQTGQVPARGCCEHRGDRLFVQEASGLAVPEASVGAAEVEELLAGALLDDPAAVLARGDRATGRPISAATISGAT